MSRWYRAYEGTATDPKFGEVALLANTSKSVSLATWHAILENCAAVNENGRFDTAPRRIAVLLGEPIETIVAVFAGLTELAMIGDGAVTAWQRRQYVSDTSAERTKRYRQRHSDGDVTSQERRVTPPDTDTDTDIKPNGLSASAPNTPPRKPKQVPTRLTPTSELSIDGLDYAKRRGFSPAEAKLIFEKMRNWSMSSAKGLKLDWHATYCNFVIGEAEKIGRTAPVEAHGADPPLGYRVKAGSDEWHTWNNHMKETTGKGIPAMDWQVPSQWPPAQTLEAAE